MDVNLIMPASEYLLHDLYYNPSSPAAFSGINQLYRTAEQHDATISHTTMRKWLAKQNIYITNRQSIAKFPRRKPITPF